MAQQIDNWLTHARPAADKAVILWQAGDLFIIAPEQVILS